MENEKETSLIFYVFFLMGRFFFFFSRVTCGSVNASATPYCMAVCSGSGRCMSDGTAKRMTIANCQWQFNCHCQCQDAKMPRFLMPNVNFNAIFYGDCQF
jgi:hypothetical protein